MKKKKKTAKATGDFNEKFKASIESEEQGLKTRIEKLGVVAYILLPDLYKQSAD